MNDVHDDWRSHCSLPQLQHMPASQHTGICEAWGSTWTSRRQEGIKRRCSAATDDACAPVSYQEDSTPRPGVVMAGEGTPTVATFITRDDDAHVSGDDGDGDEEIQASGSYPHGFFSSEI